MELYPKPVDFDESWDNLREYTRRLIIGDGCPDKNDWNDRILDVYYLCIAQPMPLGDALYQHLRRFFLIYVRSLCKHLQELHYSSLLMEYYKYWSAFYAAVPYVNQLFNYLNTEVVIKSRQCKVEADFYEIGIEYEGARTEVKELMLELWEVEIIHQLKDSLSVALFHEIDVDRHGGHVNHASVQGTILSLVDVLVFKPDPFRLYEKLFEIPFFESSTEFYKEEAMRLREGSDCCTFMWRVKRCMLEEALRVRRYLHPFTYQRIELECHSWLICEENINFINDLCSEIVQREQWQDLSNMYELLSPVEDSLDVFAMEFEEHLTNTGLAVMQSLQGDNMATQFVEGVTEFRKMYFSRVRDLFDCHPYFLTALDKACYAACNYKHHPKALCKSPEMLSKYCDALLRKTSRRLSEADLEEKLSEVITIFSYIEDKDVFQRFYSRSMAKRLLLDQSQSMDAEESMLNRLKQVCGYEYTSKLNRMFTDVTVCADITATFNEYLAESPDRQLSHAVSLSILQVGAWPLVHTNLPSLSLPPEMEKSVRMFEMFYLENYCGRKITWMHNLSHVDLRLGYCKRPYIVTMEMHMMAVLMPFNSTDMMTLNDLCEVTQLSDKDLRKQLQLLIDSKIILTQGPLRDSSEFHLNLQYTNKRTKFKILPVTRAEVVRESVQTRLSVEDDRRLFMEAAVVRIMKARKQLKHSVLMQEVISQARGRFTPHISAIKRCIEILIEKQYLQRSEESRETYNYIA